MDPLLITTTGRSIRTMRKKLGTNPQAKTVRSLLQKNYPEFKKQSQTQAEFLGNLFLHLKQTIPTGLDHKEFASRVISAISQKPGVRKEIEVLSDKIHV